MRARYYKDPISFRACSICGDVSRLFHFGLCTNCARAGMVDDLLAGDDGHIPPHHELLHHALLAGKPLTALHWMRRPKVKAVLDALAARTTPVSHQALDELRPFPVVDYLRAILVANGALPPRDEQLAALERWLPIALEEITDLGERRIVRSFATWHHVRRLRAQSKTQMITYSTKYIARRDILAAIKLVTWLRSRGVTLEACTQADIDCWLEDGTWHGPFARNFLLWTSKRGHTRRLEIPPATPLTGTQFIDPDDRWDQIRQLLHDERELDLQSRVAALLVLLFAQPAARVARIKISDIAATDDKVTLTLGAQPLELPPPLDALVLQLRDAPNANPREDNRPKEWLFPGRSPGQPRSETSLQAPGLDRHQGQARPEQRTHGLRGRDPLGSPQQPPRHPREDGHPLDQPSSPARRRIRCRAGQTPQASLTTEHLVGVLLGVQS